MGRYQVEITKEKDENDTEQKFQRIHVELKDLEWNSKSRRTSSEKFADFNILEPRIRSIRIQSLKNYQSAISQKASPEAEESVKGQENENVQRFSSEFITYSQGTVVDALWPKGKDCTDLDLRGEGSFLEISTWNLEPSKKIVHIVSLDKGVDSAQEGNVEDVDNKNDISVADETPDAIAGDEPEATSETNENTETLGTVAEADMTLPEIQGTHVGVQTEIQDGQKLDGGVISTLQNGSNSNSISIAVGNDLVLRVELETSATVADQKNDTLNNNTPYSIDAILKAREAENERNLKYTPVHNALFGPQTVEGGFIGGPQTSASLIVDENKNLEKRSAQREILLSLIVKRLLKLGVSESEAVGMTSAWHNSYIQHRPFSYRVTKTGYLGYDFDSTIKSRMLDSQKYACEFINQGKALQGALDSASCTLIEAVYFLMLPNSHLEHHTVETGADTETKESCMKDWARIILTAAHQLKPTQPSAVTKLVEKEKKLLFKPLQSIQKLAWKLKYKSLKDVMRQLQKFEKKLLRKIEPQQKFMTEILAKRFKQPQVLDDDEDYTQIELPENITAETIFANSMHLAMGYRGLMVKQKTEDKWFSYSDLNFTERRIIFLGMTDHMLSTLDAVSRTLRHLLELYTPGYPNNIINRIGTLFDDLKKAKSPVVQIDASTRMRIYNRVHSLKNATIRIESLLSQLIKMAEDVQKVIWGTKFHPENPEEFIQKVNKKHASAHLVVPFTTFRVEGLNDLKLRGFEYDEEPEVETEGQPGESSKSPGTKISEVGVQDFGSSAEHLD